MTHNPPKLLHSPPESITPTPYDWGHRIAYLRLLDADAEGANWKDVARIVLGLDPTSDTEEAHAVWAAHIARAKWMTEHGYRHYLTSDDCK